MNPTVPLRWPFVGRAIEASAVMHAMDHDEVNVILICGPAGVGKSRLAEECFVASASPESRRGRCVANPTLRTVPFGAVAHLLPQAALDVAATSSGALSMFTAVRQALGSERFLLFIDDIQYLDEASTALLVQLINARVIRLLATQRLSTELPAGLTNLLRSERLIRIDLGTFDRADTAELTRQVLGGELTSSLEMALWDSSQGNALYLRELVRGALNAGQIVRNHGIWAAVGELNSTRLLVDLVSERLDGLSARTLELAENLALCEPLGLGLIEAQGFGDEIVDLELHGIARTTRDGMRREVRLSHPLYGDSIRSRLPESSRRNILRRQADQLESLGLRRRGDDLRAVIWRLDAGVGSDCAALTRATNAASAGKDYPLTVRLSEAAISAGAGFGVIAARGEALYELGRFDEAYAVVSAAMRMATDERQLVRLAANMQRIQLWGLDDAEGAIGMLNEIQERVTHPALKQMLDATKGSVMAFSYRPREALEVVERINSELPAIRSLAGVGEAAALAQTGRTSDAVATAVGHYNAQMATAAATDPVFAALHLVTRAYALTDDGRLLEALAVATEAHAALVRGHMPLDQVWAALTAARVELIRGSLVSSRRWALEALATAEQCQIVHGQRLAVTVLAACAAQTNDLAEAKELVERLKRFWKADGFLGDEVVIGLAWGLHSLGDRDRARVEITEAADRAMRRGAVTTEAFLRHEAARLGAADDRRMEALLAVSQGSLMKARALHISGLSRRDPALLERAGEALSALGIIVSAAEACRAAALLYRNRGVVAAALRLDRRAEDLSAQSPEADTPGLRRTDAGRELTEREHDVAALVAKGMSSKEVASRLFVSVRTVDNHLRHIYTKLNITTRAELLSLFGD